jgi:hypothetical protein
MKYSKHPTENRSEYTLHCDYSEISGAENLRLGTTANSCILRSKLRGTARSSELENYCGKLNPPILSLPSFVTYIFSGDRFI